MFIDSTEDDRYFSDVMYHTGCGSCNVLGNTEDDKYFSDVIYHTGCGSCGADQYKGPSSPGRPGQCGVQPVKGYRYRLHQQHQNPRHQINDVLWGSGNH